MNDGQLPGVPERFESGHRRMQPEKAIQINGALVSSWMGNGDAWTHRVISGLTMRYHDVEIVCGATLKKHHQPFLARAGSRGFGRIHRAGKEAWDSARADNGQRSAFQKNS